MNRRDADHRHLNLERRLRRYYVCINSLLLVRKMAPLEELTPLGGATL